MNRALTIVVAVMMAVSLMGVATVAVADDGDAQAHANETELDETENGTPAVADDAIGERGGGLSVAQDAVPENVSDRLGVIADRLSEFVPQALGHEVGNHSDTADNSVLNQSNPSANGPPLDLLSGVGVSGEHITDLRDRAANLTGASVVEIAHQITGESESDDSNPPEVDSSTERGQSAPDIAEQNETIPEEANNEQ